MSIGSVYNIVHENENSDDAPPAKRCRSGPKSVFDDEATAVLVLEMIEDRSELTLAQIVDELRTEHEIETSTSSLQRFLKDCCITWKNMYKIPPHWNTPELLQPVLTTSETCHSSVYTVISFGLTKLDFRYQL